MNRSFWLLATTLLVTSCSKVYDQKLAKSDPLLDATVNEKPINRNFFENNAKHKVVLAVVDTGVDYNHPLLMDHIHFDLDDSGAPIAAGYDFVGDDAWASPYIGNTVLAEENLLTSFKEDEEKKDEDKIFTDDATKLITEKKEMFSQLKDVIKKSSVLSQYINPFRGYTEEIDNTAGHGTHVAGLSSYDDSEIGILPVRVLPATVSIKLDGKNNNDLIENSEDEVFDTIYKGIDFAIKKGAKVINLSLGGSKTIEGNEKPNIAYEKLKAMSIKLETLLKANPNVVVVAAAGNDSKWIDQDSIYNFPCGVNAPNVLCVGALKADGKLSSFTNIVLRKDINIVYASGVDLFSTYPQQMCTDKSKELFKNITAENFGELFMQDCITVTAPKIVKMSGTSMASPIVARMAAKAVIANPEMNGKEIIDLLLSRADTLGSSNLRMTFHKLQATPPSWYEDKYMVPGKMAVYALGIKFVDECYS